SFTAFVYRSCFTTRTLYRSPGIPRGLPDPRSCPVSSGERLLAKRLAVRYVPCMRESLDPLARTALWTASMRAREHARADRLFEEPLAALMAGHDGPQIMRGFEGQVQRGVEDPALAVRTRFLDDRMLQAAELDGVRQFVLVAAGMDTRAFRMAWPAETVFYE